MSLRTGTIGNVLLALTLGSGIAATAGCAPAPIRAERHPATPTAATRGCLVVLLPGLGDRAEDFARNGFVAAARRSQLACDLVALDARFPYYARGKVTERVHADVLVPARAAGYTEIWIAGISMGGVGALLTAWQHPGEIDGLILLAPYTGRGRDLKDIADAGGAREWTPPTREGSWTIELWRWLKTAGAPGSTVPPIYLAYGLDDEGTGTALLRDLLPKDHVLVRPGEHEWTVWKPLWADLLARVPLPHGGAPAPVPGTIAAAPVGGG